MIFLLCPQCENAMLETTPNGRKCPECGHSMTEMEFQVHHAHEVEINERAMDASVARESRRTFGSKPKSA
jgi:tRNA(Ile2) C34 agmatinyltransferase TiaS